ncbi:uncharacterized protein IL334_006541 [Kwoniella shivajii]|uniref:Polycomb protein EED n=1 Tax=Kwoniella shivajii TaxID=564305 RepID=A0ABZ1D7V9_9TREE|nr:hypothetical protein IL334_006541 [Kwoniella shivajii]
MNGIRDLTEEYPTPVSIEILSSSEEDNSEDEQSAGSSLKWYKKVNKYRGRGGHPYVCHAIATQGPQRKQTRYEDVKFWPYIGPLQPWKTPNGVQWSWKEYENTIATCTKGKITVARCTEKDPWKILWEMDINDHLYTITWGYHPFTCHPLIVTAGQKGLIYILDTITKECLRVLRGHGGDILWLTSHPLHPHILASTSYDKSTRIWNILGSDEPKIPLGEYPNENFPMGDADEGNCLFAILAGEGKGGHRGYVSCATFHPIKNAIATVGLDRQVKIWALPEFPKPKLKPIPTPRGYRAKIIFVPVFSTSRLHEDFVDFVDWLGDDTLITRSRQQVAIWQWLGYRRYFRPKDPLPQNIDPSVHDYNDSGSFMPISKYPLGSDCWAMNASLHRPFSPTTSELDKMSMDGHILTDPLVALVAHRVGHHAPEILLFNPLLAQDGEPPLPPREMRARSRRDSVASESEAPTSPVIGDTLMETAVEEPEDPAPAGNGNVNTQSVNVDIQQDIITEQNGSAIGPEPASGSGSAAHVGITPGPRNRSLESWRLVASDYQALVKYNSKKGWRMFIGGTNICNVAISPRGAKWIVGVGEPGTVFVWKLDD